MFTLFLSCAILGGAVLVLQLLLGSFGGDHDAGHHDLHHGGADALNLLSTRSVSAGVTFFGIGGCGALAAKLGGVPALAIASTLGLGAMAFVATLMRAMRRLESDGTVQIEHAIGEGGTVYVPIPGAKAGAGKVMLTLQNRTVELQAVTAEETLPTGTAVTVVDVVGPDTVEVVVTPHVGDLLT